jgi:hypothetical protein
VKVMNIRDDDQVSAVALVVESDAPTAASVVETAAAQTPVDVVHDDPTVAGEDAADE